MKKRIIFICHTCFHILISLEKCLVDKLDADILLSDTVEGCQELALNIDKMHIFGSVRRFEELRETEQYFNDTVLKHRNLKCVFMKHFDKGVLKELYQYDDIYLFNDAFLSGAYLQNSNIKYHLIEESTDFMKGADQPSHAPLTDRKGIFGKPWHKKWSKSIFMYHESVYFHDKRPKCVMDFEVNDKNTVPDWIEIPIIENSRIQLMELLTTDDKKNIIKCFMDENTYQMLADIHQTKIIRKKALLITQPYGVTDWCDNKKLVRYYNELIQELSRDYTVFVKPHPGDKNVYNKIDNVCFLERYWPIEILMYNDSIQFDLGITISSTSINLLTNVKEKRILGEQHLIDYLSKYTDGGVAGE